MQKKILTYLFIFLPIAAFSQFGELERPQNDTTKKETTNGAVKKYAINTIFLMEDSVLFKPAQYSHLDTTLKEIDIVDVGRRKNHFYQRINNFGSAAFNLEFTPHRSAGFNLGTNVFSLHDIKASQLRYYNSYTPYTQFRYVQGDGELQVLDIYHTQSLSEQWNFGITYHSLKSEGFYDDEANRLANVSFHTQYQNAAGNYRLLAYGIWNTSDLNESGGIENVDLFGLPEFGTQIARQSQSSLMSADQWQRSAEFGIRQMRYLGKQDSIRVKGYGNTAVFTPRAYITHKLRYQRKTAKFSTSNTGFFNNNYTLFDEMFEVLEHREVSNEVGFGLFFNKKEILQRDSNVIDKPYAEQVFYGGVDFRLGRAGFWGLERITYREPSELIKWWGYGNVHLFANLSKQLTPVTHFKGNLNYVALGSQFSDYETSLSIRQVLFKKLVLSPFLQTEAVSPNFIQNTYVSAHSRWNNDFRKEFNNSLGASLAYAQNTKITLTANRSDNFIFFDTLAKPTQFEGGITYFQIKLNKNLKLGKLNFENEVSWQQINQESPYQVPTWMLKLNYFLETPMFKQAATVRLGFRAWYYSSYNGMSYLPGLGAFYVQNEKEVGGYPWVDVYLSANIKKWNGFVKYSHVSEGLLGYNYQMLPNYPIAPRALRMGVAWRFYD